MIQKKTLEEMSTTSKRLPKKSSSNNSSKKPLNKDITNAESAVGDVKKPLLENNTVDGKGKELGIFKTR